MRPLPLKKQSLIFWFVLLFFTGLSLFVFRLEFDSEIKHRFLPDDPALAALEEEQSLFGRGEKIFILVEWAELPAFLQLKSSVKQWREELLALEGIREVFSPFDLPELVWDSPDRWHVSTLGNTADSFASLRENVPASKNFIRRDGHGFLLVLSTTDNLQNTREGIKLVSRLDRWIAKQEGPYTLKLAGALPFQALCIREAWQDALKIGVILIPVFMILLFLFFRSFAGVLVVLAMACLSIAATFGTAGLFGWRLSPFCLFAVPVILAVCLLDNIHLFYDYRSLCAKGVPPAQASHALIGDLLAPCFWTALATLAGFASLMLISVPQIRQFGALAALGTALDFAVSFGILPLVLTRLNPKPAGPLPSQMPFWFKPQIRPGVVVFSLVLMLATLPGLFRLHVIPEFPDLFHKNHPITREMHRIENEWGGMANVSFLLTLKAGHDYTDPKVIGRLRDFSNLLERRELVTGVGSPLDFLLSASRSHQKIFGEKIDAAQTADLIGRFMEEKTGGNLPAGYEGLLQVSEETLRITARVKMMQPERFPQLARDLYGFQENLSDLFDVRLTGWPLLFKNMENRLLTETLKGFALAFAAVDLLLFLPAIGSFRWWGLSLLPNILPLWVVLGMMGLFGHRLDSGLLLAPGIAMGLIVDDTIHFVRRIRHELKREKNMTAALERSLAHSGSPILLNSLILAAGFSSLFFSSFRGNVELAVVMVAVIALGVAAEFYLLPSLLRWGADKFRQSES